MTPKSYFQLRIYLKAIYKEIPSEYKYKKEIISNLEIKDLFNGGLLSYIFSWVKRTPKGDTLKTDITSYLNEVDKNIRHLVDNEPKKALELLLFLQGNIFLLNNLKLDFIEKLKGIKMIPNSSNENSMDDYWYLDILTPDIFDIFDSVSDYFDTDISGDWISDFDGDIGGDFGDGFDF